MRFLFKREYQTETAAAVMDPSSLEAPQTALELWEERNRLYTEVTAARDALRQRLVQHEELELTEGVTREEIMDSQDDVRLHRQREMATTIAAREHVERYGDDRELSARASTEHQRLANIPVAQEQHEIRATDKQRFESYIEHKRQADALYRMMSHDRQKYGSWWTETKRYGDGVTVYAAAGLVPLDTLEREGKWRSL